jgi:putative peptidoglycan lipid II flippase
MILTLTVPAAVGLLLLGRPFTVLLLQRGAFESQDTARVVWALYFLSLGLVGHSALEVVSRVFYARRDMWTPLWAALAGLAVNGLLGWALLPSLAQGAIALGNSVGVCVQVAVLWLALRARVGGLEAGALSSSLTRTAMGTALMSVAVLGVRALITGFLLDLFLALVVAVTVYVNAQLLLGNEELAELLNLVAQELRRWISLVRLKLVSDEGV